jgi:hypothetical protein
MKGVSAIGGDGDDAKSLPPLWSPKRSFIKENLVITKPEGASKQCLVYACK